MISDQFLEAQDLEDLERNTNDFIISYFKKNNFQLQFYSEELLISVKARHNWVEPNLRPIKSINCNFRKTTFAQHYRRFYGYFISSMWLDWSSRIVGCFLLEFYRENYCF